MLPYMSSPAAYLIGGVLALIATILVFAFVMPRSKNGKLGSRFLQFLHDLFHFKKLYLEPILKFIYTFATFAAIFGGFVGLILGISSAVEYGVWTPVLVSLGIMVLGPIALRIAYEFMIMGVLLVLNVIEINRKLKVEQRARARERESRPVERSSYMPPQPRATFCPRCGSKYDASLPVCPTCGRANI